MGQVTSYASGTPAWVDLMTSDPEGSRRFYGELFGWDFQVGPAEAGHYTMCQLHGLDVAGMGGDPAPEPMPTAWTTYMAIDDADAAAKRIVDNGGQLMMGPMDVMDQGRMAVAIDPTGAVFGLWQAGRHHGASLVNEPGTVSWNQVETRDLDAARRFYSAVFGYSWDDVDTGPGGPAYATFSVQGRVAGGALKMDDSWPANIPAHWMPYFAVADTDAAVATVGRLGGTVQLPPMDSPYGRFAVVSDPQGGVFTVIRPTTPS